MSDHPDISPAQISAQVDAWLAEHWSPALRLQAWRELLVDGGWAAPAWPVAYFGRNYSAEQAAAVAVGDPLGLLAEQLASLAEDRASGADDVARRVARAEILCLRWGSAIARPRQSLSMLRQGVRSLRARQAERKST